MARAATEHNFYLFVNYKKCHYSVAYFVLNHQSTSEGKYFRDTKCIVCAFDCAGGGDITSYLMGCPGGGHTVNYVRGHNIPFNLLSRGQTYN